MKAIKLICVILFGLGVSLPMLSARLARFTGMKSTVVKAATLTPEEEAKYIGSSSCSECHTNQAAHYALTAHAKTMVKGNNTKIQGCEACHGGARDHVAFYQGSQQLIKEGKDAEAQTLMNDEAKAKAAQMLSFKNIPAAQASEACLKCHEGSQGKTEERFNFRRSEHSRHGLSCLDCHSSHAPERVEFLLRKTEPNMCYTCHAEQKATFAKPFHHKVPEGAIKCSDCHNQHGGFMGKSLRNSINGDMSCLKCHADKQGPFVYEHAPIKVEGCQACHTPHGSTNPKLLTRNLVRFLCLECHSNTPGIVGEGTGLGVGTPSFHDITNPRYQNCTVCHLEIHGSNKDPFFR